MALVNPHGKAKKLMPLLLTGAEFAEESRKAETLLKVHIASRESGDLIMMGIGGFTPLTGFMTQADWKGVCSDFKMADGTFWPIPITVSVSKVTADGIKIGEEIALYSEDFKEIMATMKVTEKYSIDKEFECKNIYKTTDTEHPGVKMVMEQAEVNLAGPVKVLSLGTFPRDYPGLFLTPAETRKMFEEMGWNTVAALQLRNPMHRSHEFLAKVAIEICDGVLIHQLLGKLKPGDIPAEVRVKAINKLVELYFVPKTCIQAGYPLDMRYAGPREALLHATFRQNYGCSYMIIGRDHAGVGEYYGPFDAQKIFLEIPKDALETKPLNIDWTFYCKKCDGMASMKTCPHGKDDRVLLSGTKLRKMLSEGEEVTSQFSRPEVAAILKEYYQGLTEKVEIKTHKYSEGV
ncbi:MAG TPA: sulfate adenylyltransferase [Dissulfurispiraceae bacterium]|nr:sulfate adenylyltransferase [Dissulfurispiraceae bacterium]